MQKKIIALAVAGLASSAAFAQTNVTIYGIMDAAAYATDGTTNRAANYGFTSSALSTSRLGFKGTEDLGNGLKAVFNIEGEVVLATGQLGSSSTGTGAGTFNRAANVGLDSKLGTVLLGRQAAPTYLAVAAADVLGANSGGLLNAWVQTNLQTSAGAVLGATPGLTNASFSSNVQNGFVAGVGYASPVLAGLQVKAFSNFGNNTANADFENGGVRDISVSYAGFGANVIAAYQQQMAAGSGRVEKTNAVLGANYTVAGVKLGAAWAQTRYDNPLVAGDVNTASVGASYQMGKTNVGLSYTDTRVTTDTQGGNNTTNQQNNAAKQIALLAKYSVSKRTDLYALGVHVINEGGANVGGIYGGNAPLAQTQASGIGGINNTSVALGVRHFF